MFSRSPAHLRPSSADIFLRMSHSTGFSSPPRNTGRFASQLWDSLPSAERRFYTQFLDSLGYDGSDRFLAVNEFQAYLMQQPLEYAPSYFDRFLARFDEPGTGGAVEAAGLVATAKELDGFLHSRFEIHAGETVRPTAQRAHAVMKRFFLALPLSSLCALCLRRLILMFLSITRHCDVRRRHAARDQLHLDIRRHVLQHDPLGLRSEAHGADSTPHRSRR